MLENKEKLILSAIINDARAPLTIISKKTRLSRELITYHLKKLEKEGYILGYQARLNLSCFIPTFYNLLIKLKKRNRQTETKFMEKLKKLPYTTFMAKISGEYDYITGFGTKTTEDLRNYLDTLHEEFGELIARQELLTELHEIKDDFRSLIGENSAQKSQIPIRKKRELDEIDKKILLELTKNARTNAVEIANTLSMTSAAITYRIRRLEEDQIILGYRTILNLHKFQNEFYFIFFDISHSSKADHEKTQKEIIANPNIIFGNRLAGSHSYLILMYAYSNKEFAKKLEELEKAIPDMTNVNVALFLEMIEHNYLVEGILD